MSELIKPCDLPCPKCGSADISRSFLAEGDAPAGERIWRTVRQVDAC
jgi:hypothetical protein